MKPSTQNQTHTTQPRRLESTWANITTHSIPNRKLPFARSRNFAQFAIVAIVLLTLSSPCRPSHVSNHFSRSRSRLHFLTQEERLPDFLEENLIDDHSLKQWSKSVSLENETPSQTESTSNVHQENNQNHNQHHLKWFTELNLANTHLSYIRTKFSCSQPRAKLVKVLEIHPSSPSKQYVPRCTVLHQCDEESGCCEDVTHRCTVSKAEEVYLYFHVIRSDVRNNITGGSAVGIEKLPFLNHTKCACTPINYKPRAEFLRPPMPSIEPRDHGKLQEGHNKCKHIIECAKPFRQFLRDLTCVCDCIANLTGRTWIKDKHCQDIQNGIVKLDTNEAMLVRNGKYPAPVCANGYYYSIEAGKCQSSRHLHKSHKMRHHRRDLWRTDNHRENFWNWLH